MSRSRFSQVSHRHQWSQ